MFIQTKTRQVITFSELRDLFPALSFPADGINFIPPRPWEHYVPEPEPNPLPEPSPEPEQ